MCLDAVYTNIGKELTIKHLPEDELIQGWKVVSGIKTSSFIFRPIYHLTGLYIRSLSFKKRWNKAKRQKLFNRPESRDFIYWTGFHVFADEWAAGRYAKGEGPYAYIMPVYFKKQNIKTSGSQIGEIVYVLDKMYIKSKDFKRTLKQYKKALQAIRET